MSDTANTNVDTEADPGQRNWNTEAEVLYGLLCDHVPSLHPIRHELHHVDQEQGFEWRRDHQQEVANAVRRFYRELTPAEQRRILNGWTPRKRRPTSAQLDPSLAGFPVRLGVSIELTGGAEIRGWCYAEWHVDESIHATDVVIYENKTKAEVMAELRRKIDWIDDNWQEIQTKDPSRLEPEGIE